MSSLGGWYCSNNRDQLFQAPGALLIPSATSLLNTDTFTRVRRHIWFCVSPPAVLLVANVISVPWRGTRNFTHARCCAVLGCGHSRASLPFPPPRLDLQLSLTNEAISLLNLIFLYVHSQLQWDILWNAKSGVGAAQFRGINPPFLLLLCLQVLKSGLGKTFFSVFILPGVSKRCFMMGRSLCVLQCMFNPLGIDSIHHVEHGVPSIFCSCWSIGPWKHQAPSGLTLAFPSPVYCGSTQTTSAVV